jgi:hypothetical protein
MVDVTIIYVIYNTVLLKNKVVLIQKTSDVGCQYYISSNVRTDR